MATAINTTTKSIAVKNPQMAERAPSDENNAPDLRCSAKNYELIFYRDQVRSVNIFFAYIFASKFFLKKKRK